MRTETCRQVRNHFTFCTLMSYNAFKAAANHLEYLSRMTECESIFYEAFTTVRSSVETLPKSSSRVKGVWFIARLQQLAQLNSQDIVRSTLQNEAKRDTFFATNVYSDPSSRSWDCFKTAGGDSCCESAAFRLLFAGSYTSATQRTAEEYQLGRTS